MQNANKHNFAKNMQFHLDLYFSVIDVKFVDILLTSINFFRTKTDLRATIEKNDIIMQSITVYAILEWICGQCLKDIRFCSSINLVIFISNKNI